ncbi:hypothetical protein SPRG_13014 [Saprolegnia parasitica CBS 223.65]|uniref:Uncharacterized protein n=1 Tax=Saprolegnia parasitica (strain CBS 223.65) TaxID=695850 RepID=A0A067C586_SAPPC|nr:hypothetical protein SPRG_13014 [Saprolegnia parasitica CBS 223.65]KDO21676.1 hypothetical protein SPRG_13014 [Saprolegnia parasitica CBS 223.65]|eukprot:XP_012207599.1 hypothetical protein SPRG_13014 [Saprolegnia parasitica CBS 223.65]
MSYERPSSVRPRGESPTLSDETLERNRERSKQYYAMHRDKVLAKLKSKYAQKREAETKAYYEKHRCFFESYFKVDVPTTTRELPSTRGNESTTALSTQERTTAAGPLDLSFILN